MKYVIPFLLCLITLGSTGCKKDKGPAPSVTGTWELRTSVLYSGTTQHPAGNGTILQFDGSNYKRYYDNVAHDSGTYKISKTAYPGGNGSGYRVVFENGSDSFYRFENGKLTFYSNSYTNPGMADGGSSTYEKIEPGN